MNEQDTPSAKDSNYEKYIKDIHLPRPSNVSKDSDTVHMRLHIWDTSGQERFRALSSIYYRDADAAILMFDMGD